MQLRQAIMIGVLFSVSSFASVQDELPSQVKVSGERAFVFSPHYKQWAAYNEEGVRVAYGLANGGSDYCADIGKPCRTPAGTYRVLAKKDADCKSRQFPVPEGGAPMPYCMYFSKGGHAIHGSAYIGQNNSSHGCIRVTTQAAQWLNHYFMSTGTRVEILPY